MWLLTATIHCDVFEVVHGGKWYHWTTSPYSLFPINSTASSLQISIFSQLSCEVSFIPLQRTDKGGKKYFLWTLIGKTVDFKNRNEGGSLQLNPLSLSTSKITLFHQPSSKQALLTWSFQYCDVTMKVYSNIIIFIEMKTNLLVELHLKKKNVYFDYDIKAKTSYSQKPWKFLIACPSSTPHDPLQPRVPWWNTFWICSNKAIPSNSWYFMNPNTHNATVSYLLLSDS